MMQVEVIRRTEVLDNEIESHEMYLKQVQTNTSVELHLSKLREKHTRITQCTNINDYLMERYNTLYQRYVELSDTLVNSQFVTTFLSRKVLQKDLANVLGRLDEVSTIILMMEQNR